MAVCADQLAFLDLREDQRAIVSLQQGTDIVELGRTGQVIPVHGGRMEVPTAIGTGCRTLQGRVPGDDLFMPPTFLDQPPRPGPLMVEGVVGSATFLAPGLVAGTTPVEVLERASLPAFPARLHRTFKSTTGV
jgi:hypothetical protein